MTRDGRAELERLKAEHHKKTDEDGAFCGSCVEAPGDEAWPCLTSRLIAALEEALALEHKHCGLEFCEAEDEALAKLAEG